MTSRQTAPDARPSIEPVEVREPKAVSTLRRGPRSHTAVSVLIVLLLAAIGTSLLAERTVDHQEDAILDSRAGDAEGVVSQSFASIQATMESLAASVAAQSQPSAQLQRSVQPALTSGRVTGAAVLKSTGATTAVLGSAGSTGFRPGQSVDANLSKSALRALSLPNRLTVAPSVGTGTDYRIGLTLHSSTLPLDETIYVETTPYSLLPRPTLGRNLNDDIFTALYAGSTANPTALWGSTSVSTPLGGELASRSVMVGNDPFLLVVSARHDLVGTLARALPWVLLTVGALSAFLVSFLVEVLTRRRRYALDLVANRTQALQASLRTLEQRSELDAFLRKVSNEVAAAATMQDAIDAFFGTIREQIPADRVSISVPEGGTLRLIAVAGQVNNMSAGATYAANNTAVREILAARTTHVLQAVHDHAPMTGMKTVATVPLLISNEVHAIISVSVAKGNAISAEQLPVLEALGRECAAVFNQLLLLEREREAALRFQELDQLKSEFVGIVAHDLRSPMTVIAGFADLLRTHADSFTEEQKAEYLGRISINIKELAELVEDVLQVARIESGEMTCQQEPFDLAAMIRRTADELTANASEHPCNVVIPDDLPLALGDERRSWQVFSNLTTNALKFSAQDAPIDIRAQRRGNFIEVSVQDHGIGIRSEDIPRLFKKFSRVTQPGGGKVGGTGLGLYIAESLVRAQGGTIDVESKEGEGSTFRYSIPVAP